MNTFWSRTTIARSLMTVALIALLILTGALAAWQPARASNPLAPPYTPTNPLPADGATNVPLDADLGWDGGDPDAADTVTYDIFFEAEDTSPDVLVSDNQAGTTYDLGPLDASTHYYWQVISTDGTSTVKGPVWDFTTVPFMEDQYEPNNDFATAYGISVNSTTTKISFYPSGDVDFFKFWGKVQRTYDVRTVMVDGGLDSYMWVYGPAGAGQLLGQNDDAAAGDLGSRVVFVAPSDGYYFIKLTNLDPTDPIDKTYRLEVNEVAGTPSPTPTGTAAPATATVTPLPIAGADPFEPNYDFDHASILGTGVQYDNLNFVPWAGSDPNAQDNDFFRIWVKPGLFYACETFNLSPGTDTNMIFYLGPSFDLGGPGNDDRAPGDFSSRVTWYSTYTGWLYILVGPVWGGVPPYQLSPFTYSIKCTTGQPPTLTPVPSSTPRPAVPQTLPTYTPLPTYTSFPTATPSPAGAAANTPVSPPSPTATPQPIPLNILPLPTTVPAGRAGLVMTIDILIYYDANQNANPELEEGIRDVDVAVYDSVSNELVAFGYTNESGGLHFGPLTVTSAARLEIPYLGYSRRLTEAVERIEIQIAPQPLPVTIP